MKVSRGMLSLAVLASVAVFALRFVLAADPAAESSPQQAIADAAQEGKLIYVVFHKEANQAAKAMAGAVRQYVGETGDETTWTAVRVNDPSERAIAEKYAVTRAPMPMLLALHPNGAVTGVFQSKVTSANLSACLVTPKKAECLKMLQSDQLVLLCVQAAPGSPVPSGVRKFQADPHFAKRARVVTVGLSDPVEAPFLTSLEVDPQRTSAPLTVLMAPPGVLVGTFSATATKDDLAAKLAASGKCCDDKNCKHNQRAAK
jgi:hypothetical protein